MERCRSGLTERLGVPRSFWPRGFESHPLRHFSLFVKSQEVASALRASALYFSAIFQGIFKSKASIRSAMRKFAARSTGKTKFCFWQRSNELSTPNTKTFLFRHAKRGKHFQIQPFSRGARLLRSFAPLLFRRRF